MDAWESSAAHPGADEITGSQLVVLHDTEAGTADLRNVAGIRSVARSLDFESADTTISVLEEADAVVFDSIGIAVISPDPDQVAALSEVAGIESVATVEPERWRYALPDTIDYLRGHRDAADAILHGLSNGGAPAGLQTPLFADTRTATWGLQAIGALAATVDGTGANVAVLDTGVTLAHPDLAGRIAVGQSFVPNQPVDDLHGHGTHCCGTIAGSATPAAGRRFGVAPGASLHVGKVLGNDGRGRDTWILAGIDWAVQAGCQVISMSLGSDVPTASPAYEAAGQRALAEGTLIVAAAGNNAKRPRSSGFVGQPANSTSVVAVGAVEPTALDVASFSATSTPPPGGQVDVAGPGVDVYSAAPGAGYKTMSGTSMATPHIAGLAALIHEATGMTGAALWGELVRTAQRIPPSSMDVGAGLGFSP